MANLLEAVVEHSEATAELFDDELLPAIERGDAEAARDYAIATVRRARPALALIDILVKIHGREDKSGNRNNGDR